MSKRPVGYFEKDGSYNEREPRKQKPRTDDSFRLDFEKPIRPQVEGKVSKGNADLLALLVEAYRALEYHGCLPGNRYLQMRRQLNMKADRYVRKFKKDTTP